MSNPAALNFPSGLDTYYNKYDPIVTVSGEHHVLPINYPIQFYLNQNPIQETPSSISIPGFTEISGTPIFPYFYNVTYSGTNSGLINFGVQQLAGTVDVTYRTIIGSGTAERFNSLQTSVVNVESLILNHIISGVFVHLSGDSMTGNLNAPSFSGTTILGGLISGTNISGNTASIGIIGFGTATGTVLNANAISGTAINAGIFSGTTATALTLSGTTTQFTTSVSSALISGTNISGNTATIATINNAVFNGQTISGSNTISLTLSGTTAQFTTSISSALVSGTNISGNTATIATLNNTVLNGQNVIGAILISGATITSAGIISGNIVTAPTISGSTVNGSTIVFATLISGTNMSGTTATIATINSATINSATINNIILNSQTIIGTTLVSGATIISAGIISGATVTAPSISGSTLIGTFISGSTINSSTLFSGVAITSSDTISGNFITAPTISGNIYSIMGNMTPTASGTSSLGSLVKPFNNLFSNNILTTDGLLISGNIVNITSNSDTINIDGNILPTSSGTENIGSVILPYSLLTTQNISGTSFGEMFLSGNSTTTTFTAANTPTAISGTFIGGLLENFNFTSNPGKLTYVGAISKTFKIIGNIFLSITTSSGQYTGSIGKNGSKIIKTSSSFTGFTPALFQSPNLQVNVSPMGLVVLAPNDTIQLMLENNVDTTSSIVPSCIVVIN